MNGPDPRRREELLELAERLATRLRSVEVPHLRGQGVVSRGIPASVLAHAASYLARFRDIGRFREFLARIDQLDPITAQNPDNPKADHRVLRAELEAFLTEQPDLTADELLYVLSWVRRLLPKSSELPPGGRRPDRRGGGSGPSSASGGDTGAAPIRGGQLAAALARAGRSPDQKPGRGGGAAGRRRKR